MTAVWTFVLIVAFAEVIHLTWHIDQALRDREDDER